MTDQPLKLLEKQPIVAAPPSVSDEPIPAPKTSFLLWGFIGNLIILVVFVTIGWWGFVAPLASAVVTSGFVTVDTNRKAVGHLEGGIVKTIHVKNGSRVTAGETLISLDETTVKARRDILRARIDDALARIGRLDAEIDHKEHILFPETLTGRVDSAAVQRLMARENKVFLARRLAREGERDILIERVKQIKQEIIGLEAELTSENERHEIATREHENLAKLLEKGFVSLSRVLDLKRELAQLQGNIGRITSSIARSKRSISEINLQIIQGQKEFDQTVLTELAEAQSQLKQSQEEFASAESVLERVVITSPVSGTVVNLAVHSSGAVIRPSDTILEVVPDKDELLIEVRVAPQDIDNVLVDHDANVRFTAFKQRTTPQLNGSVAYVSPDTNIDQQTGQPYYVARVSVGLEELERLGESQLTPGMPADVMIETGSRTAAQYMVQPIIDSMNKAWREN